MRAFMAGRHWLDPLARRLLVATGQLTAAVPAAGQACAPASGDRDGEAVERELLALKLAQNPALRLRNGEEVRHAAALGWQLDVNRASAADWLRLPGCRPDQVDLLQRLRHGGVQLSGPDDLAQALQIPPEQIRSWLPVLRFRWYGEPEPLRPPAPLAINRATRTPAAAAAWPDGRAVPAAAAGAIPAAVPGSGRSAAAPAAARRSGGALDRQGRASIPAPPARAARPRPEPMVIPTSRQGELFPATAMAARWIPSSQPELPLLREPDARLAGPPRRSPGPRSMPGPRHRPTPSAGPAVLRPCGPR